MVSYKALNTTNEAPISQARDGIGNGDGGQTAAIIEAIISQPRDGIWNGDGGQTVAKCEAPISQARDGIWNGDGGQTAATREARSPQTRDCIGNLAIFTTSNHLIRWSFNDGIAIISWIIYRVVRFHYYTLKTITSCEASFSQTCDWIGNGDGGQTAAQLEATLPQTRDGIWNGDGGQTAATIEATLSQTCDWIGNGDGGQTAAQLEATLPQTRDGFGNGDGCQIATPREAIISQTRDGIDCTIHGHIFRDNYFSGVVASTTFGHIGFFLSLVQIVKNAIDFCIMSPSGIYAKEQSDEYE